MEEELLYQIALTLVPDLGAIKAKILVEKFGSALAIFRAKKKEIAATEGIGEITARSLKEWNALREAEAEIRFMEQYDIRALFLTDKDYPQRLLHCYDPPTLLYYRGHCNFNSARIISIIGTRNHTDYGKQVTEQLIASLQQEQVLVISGLAFGIDSIAHKNALQNGLQTVAVLGHGLDTVYPYQNKPLAKEILQQGALLTEFPAGTKPDKHNFPRRNRIVAGMSDAILVIETAIKGGSMITAELACSYNRDLFAVPGKITDSKSSGCLQLIKQNKAILFTGAEQLLETMGWQEKKKISKKQKELFIELSKEESILINLLKEKETVAIDELYLQSGLTSSSVAAAILNLEIQNLIMALPGKMYKLL